MMLEIVNFVFNEKIRNKTGVLNAVFNQAIKTPFFIYKKYLKIKL